MKTRSALLILTLLLAAGFYASAQDPAASDDSAGSQVFFESLDVNLVNVEVYVTDRQGNPVRGLTKDDFEVYEDGRRQLVSNFTAVSSEGKRPRALGVPNLPVPEGEVPESIAVEQPQVSEDQRLHLIVYLDNLYLKPFGRNKVSREVQSFLDSYVGPEDRVLVATFERSLNIRQPFTADRAAIAKALRETEKLTAFAVQNEQERRQVIQRIEASDSLQTAEVAVESYAGSAFQDVRTSIRGLKELISSLGGLPGRKAILHVSEGMPMTAAEDLFRLLDIEFGQVEGVGGQLRAQRYNARPQYRELISHANANRVTFYTLDAAGLKSRSSVSAVNRGAARGGSQIELDFIEQSNMSEPLQMIARDTGGRSVFNTNNFKLAFDQMATDFDDYYSLGYLPAHNGDGRYHSIEVKLKNKVRGYELRHRAGYRDKTLETRLNEGVLASLHHGVGVNPHGLRVKTAKPKARRDRFYQVPVEVEIPIGSIAMVPQGDAYHGRLVVVVAAINRDGGTSVPEQKPIPLVIPAAEFERAQQQHITYEAELLMRAGSQEVAVGLRDEFSGKTSFIRRVVQVG
ncbi:MAG: VWA domain-containing protein [Acidobacteriota bacterium]